MELFIFKPQRLYLPSSTFDLVTSRLALHYIEHLDTIFSKCVSNFKTNGTFTFSVQHPLLLLRLKAYKQVVKERVGSSMITLN